MQRSEIDALGAAFTTEVSHIVSQISFSRQSEAVRRAVKRLDTNPASLLRFLAEVAQRYYGLDRSLLGLRRRFPASMTREVCDLLQARLGAAVFSEEDRLRLFWAALSRVIGYFSVTYTQYSFTEKQLTDFSNECNGLLACAVAYHCCSKAEARKVIERGQLSL